jgi:hypothetical protein
MLALGVLTRSSDCQGTAIPLQKPESAHMPERFVVHFARSCRELTQDQGNHLTRPEIDVTSQHVASTVTMR